MKTSKKEQQIIFINRDKMFFCDPNKNDSNEFPLNSEIIKDLEVVDQVKLEESLRSYLGENTETLSETLIILNKNTYFSTTIENPELDEIATTAKIDKFSDLVPFNNIFVKQFLVNKKLEVIAINKDFYEPILDVLFKLNFKITMILPELVVTDFIGEASCTPEENSALLKAVGKLGSYDLLGSKHKLITKNSSEIEPIKIQNKRLIVMVIIFLFLIFILIGAIIFNSNRNMEYEAQIAKQNLIIEELPLKNELEEKKLNPALVGGLDLDSSNSSTSSDSNLALNPDTLELNKYKIRVLNGSGISGQAGILKTNLEKVGFADIDLGNAQKIESNKTQIIFLSTLSTNVRTIILDVVNNLDQEYTIQENSELNYDVVITTTAAK